MESITTELEIVPHKIGAPRKIQVHKMQLQNFHLHTCTDHLASMLAFIIKASSNNASSELIPRDVTALRLAFEGYKATYKFALDNNNGPQATIEQDYYILVPTKDEIQKIKNRKFKQVALHIDRLIEIIFSVDSAHHNANIGIQSQSDIDAQTAICEQALVLWVGSGSDNSNTGISLPVYKPLGTVKPDFDTDASSVREYDPNPSTVGRPDTPDIPVTGD